MGKIVLLHVFVLSVILTCFSILGAVGQLEEPEVIDQPGNSTSTLKTRFGRDELDKKPESLLSFLQRVVKNYGDKKVASSIYELAQKSMYELLWMLAGDLDTWLIYDLYKVYSYTQADAVALSVFERFRSGNVDRTIVPTVFELDKKYNMFPWWKRVRARMLINVEKYIGGTLVLNSSQIPSTFPPLPEGTPPVNYELGDEDDDDEE